MIVVMTNGLFDVLDVGHIRHLKEARSLGDRLIVALTTDQSMKGYRPVNPWPRRAEVLLAIRYVDEVVPCSGSLDAFYKIKPDIFSKGIADRDRQSVDFLKNTCDRFGVEFKWRNFL